jgi:hypothetical protein
MVRLKPIILWGLVTVIGIGVVLYLFPSEEKKIKKQFRLLAEWVSKEAGENPITMAYKIKKIETLFDGMCEFGISLYSFSGSYTPEEITGYAARGRLSFSQLHVKFYDLKIAFPERGIAKATLTAKVTGKSNGGEHIDEAHELESLLKKVGKGWFFSKFETVEVLKK